MADFRHIPVGGAPLGVIAAKPERKSRCTVEHRAHGDAATRQLVARHFDVVDDEVHGMGRARRRGGETGAVQAGVLSTLAAGGAPIGALNLFSAVEHGFGDATRAPAALFAVQAAVTVANAQTAAQAAAQFEAALASRAVIDQAKGILIAAHGCSPDEAFTRLRERSQHENRKLRSVAEEIVAQAQRSD